jgi:hypothetical protein
MASLDASVLLSEMWTTLTHRLCWRAEHTGLPKLSMCLRLESPRLILRSIVEREKSRFGVATTTV